VRSRKGPFFFPPLCSELWVCHFPFMGRGVLASRLTWLLSPLNLPRVSPYSPSVDDVFFPVNTADRNLQA